MIIINKRINFRQMDSDQVIEDYINKRLEKIEDFLQHEQTPIDIDFTIVPSKTREHHQVEIRVKSPNYDLVAEIEKQGTDFYDAVNIVIDKMMNQLHKAKQRRIDERNDGKPYADFIEMNDNKKGDKP